MGGYDVLMDWLVFCIVMRGGVHGCFGVLAGSEMDWTGRGGLVTADGGLKEGVGRDCFSIMRTLMSYDL